MTITFGSLFAGIGGFDLGLERAGMKCAWQVELGDYATRILEKHWPHVTRHRDVRECGQHNLEPVDLICGGFPCQPHSFAGMRKGSDDARDLWEEFARIIRELEPRWVLAENVPGILSTESGRYFGCILRDLATLGYDVEWECIPASVVGAPHRRERIWIFATKRMVPDADRLGCQGSLYREV
ncbi:MAG: DNA (cytosine-5-)-methyltransferase, partial [Deltaproteobacteria bacterium]|nr:DNA (cytosine-5-)-methyltransferase [Deltaproteobacteria bacterium]